MNRVLDILLTDLRHMITDLGRDGGLIGPSVYETAQVLRFAPPPQGPWPAIEWLLTQQCPDGGWGDPRTPLARDIPTLAAVLALHNHRQRKEMRDAIQAGVTFLRRQAAQWQAPLPDDIPLAAELILPTLLAQARALEIDIPQAPYAALSALGAKRRRIIAQLELRPGTTAVHSWEAWGKQSDTSLFDGAGSLGHNPAATAAWLAATRERADLSDVRAAAHCYLEHASLATGTGIPGVMPAVWPYPRNEQTVSLFMIFLAGLLRHGALRTALDAQELDLWNSVRPEGQGISDHFATDGDLTAMTFAIGAATGRRPNVMTLRRYIVGDSCLTYPHEMHRSLSATAHAAHTLAMLGDDPMPLLHYLLERRTPDCRWNGDKWHASWLYLTSQTIHALLAAGRVEDALASLPALLDHQHPDGSWGVTEAIAEETSYGVLALLAFAHGGSLPETGRCGLQRAGRWLISNYRPLSEEQGACWIAKGLYRPRRIARVIEISATLGYLLLDGTTVAQA
jgi:Prenyltransferase and squalene oxidase repeat